MALRPPLHLGLSRGEWTVQMQQDWRDFQIQQRDENMHRMSDFFYSGPLLLLLVALAPTQNLIATSRSIALLVPLLILCALSSIARWSQRLLSATAIVLCMGTVVTRIHYSMSLETELNRHRGFLLLTHFSNVLWSSLAFPFWFHTWVRTPCLWISYLIFHYLVGMWNLRVAVIGFVACVPLPLWDSMTKERLQWQNFHAMKQLDRDKNMLEAMQQVLRSMLSSLWDASCVCNTDGTIDSSTPQLEQMLGGKNVAGSNLISFAPSGDDKDRLRAFLQNIARTSTPQAFTMQCTTQAYRLSSSPDSDDHVDPASQEVVLHGIRLPQGVSSESRRSENQDDHLIFVGIEVIKLDATVPDEVNATVQAAVKDLMMSDFYGDVPGHPAADSTHTAVEDLNELADAAMPGVRLGSSLAFSMSLCSTETRCCMDQGVQVGSPCFDAIDSATQTDEIENLVPSMSESRLFQALDERQHIPEFESSQSSAVTRNTYENMEPNASQLQYCKAFDGRQQHAPQFESSGSSTARRPPLVNSFLRPLLSRYRVTESGTMHDNLCRMIRLWNTARDDHMCCAFHCNLRMLKVLLRSKRYSKCRPLWSPHTGWQCQKCTGMNHDNDDMCEACHEEDDYFFRQDKANSTARLDTSDWEEEAESEEQLEEDGLAEVVCQHQIVYTKID